MERSIAVSSSVCKIDMNEAREWILCMADFQRFLFCRNGRKQLRREKVDRGRSSRGKLAEGQKEGCLFGEAA
jgi:hypothetical protein